jgi:hypothetical protein
MVAALAVAPASSGAPAKSKLVIRLVSITTAYEPRDVAPAGASAGDSFFSASRLQNAVAQFGRAKGAVVGSDRGTARFVSATEASVTGVATLPGGSLWFRGRIKEGRVELVPVVGGSGRFARARGTLAITYLGRPGTALNVYTVTLGS